MSAVQVQPVAATGRGRAERRTATRPVYLVVALVSVEVETLPHFKPTRRVEWRG
jgi:hypothetical protein